VVEERNPELASDPTVEKMAEYLRSFVGQTPLDILCEALSRWSNAETAGLILDSYDAFIARLDDRDNRERLKSLSPEHSADDELFQELQEHTRTFEKGLERLFFDDNPVLTALNREYGVF
jgi:hypothetical protein